MSVWPVWPVWPSSRFFVVPNSFHRLRISYWMNNSSRPEPDVNKTGKGGFTILGEWWANIATKQVIQSSTEVWTRPCRFPWTSTRFGLPPCGNTPRAWGRTGELNGMGLKMGALCPAGQKNPFPSFPHSTCRTSNHPTLVMENIIIYRWFSHQTSIKTRTFNCHSWWHRRVNGHWYAQNWNERIHVRVS